MTFPKITVHTTFSTKECWLTSLEKALHRMRKAELMYIAQSDTVQGKILMLERQIKIILSDSLNEKG